MSDFEQLTTRAVAKDRALHLKVLLCILLMIAISVSVAFLVNLIMTNHNSRVSNQAGIFNPRSMTVIDLRKPDDLICDENNYNYAKYCSGAFIKNDNCIQYSWGNLPMAAGRMANGNCLNESLQTLT